VYVHTLCLVYIIQFICLEPCPLGQR